MWLLDRASVGDRTSVRDFAVSISVRVRFRVKDMFSDCVMILSVLASGLGIVRVQNVVYGSQLAQPRCRLGFAHAICVRTCNNILIYIERYSRGLQGRSRVTDDVGESFPLDIPGSWMQSDADVAAIVINVN